MANVYVYLHMQQTEQHHYPKGHLQTVHFPLPLVEPTAQKLLSLPTSSQPTPNSGSKVAESASLNMQAEYTKPLKAATIFVEESDNSQGFSTMKNSVTLLIRLSKKYC